MLNDQKQTYGITLLELVLALVIISIMLLMAVRYFQLTRFSQQVNAAQDIIANFYTAGQSWLQSNDDFSGVTVWSFANENLVPRNFTADGANPWGGDIQARPNPKNASALDVILTHLPSKACQQLKSSVALKYANTQTDCATAIYQGGVPLTVTFSY